MESPILHHFFFSMLIRLSIYFYTWKLYPNMFLIYTKKGLTDRRQFNHDLMIVFKIKQKIEIYKVSVKIAPD